MKDHPETNAALSTAAGRLESLDVLRGFAMFLLRDCGLVAVLAMFCGMTDITTFEHHAAWAGCNFHDIIAPLFIFAAGASFPLSLAKSRAKGMTEWAIFRKALRRFALLFLVGLFESLYRFPQVEGFPPFGTLQLIALSVFGASLVYMLVRPRWRLVAAMGVFGLMTFVHCCIVAPGAPAGATAYSPEGNVIQWLHRALYMSSFIDGRVNGVLVDSAGPFNAPNAAVLSLLGMFAVDVISADGMRTSWRKALRLLGCSATCALGAFILSLFLPPVKNIWTSTFVLLTATVAYALFALFYWVVDVLEWRKWAFFFKLFGMNVIVIYLVREFIDFRYTYNLTFGLAAKFFPGLWGNLYATLSWLFMEWALLYFLYRKKIFVKIG